MKHPHSSRAYSRSDRAIAARLDRAPAARRSVGLEPGETSSIVLPGETAFAQWSTLAMLLAFIMAVWSLFS